MAEGWGGELMRVIDGTVCQAIIFDSVQDLAACLRHAVNDPEIEVSVRISAQTCFIDKAA